MNTQNVPAAQAAGQAALVPHRAPQIPSASRNTSAVLTQELVHLSSRVQITEDSLATNHKAISGLQMSNAQSKDKQEEHTVEIEFLKSQLEQVRAHLALVLEALGLNDILASSGARAVPMAAEVAYSRPIGVVEDNPVVAAGPSNHVIKSEPEASQGDDKIQAMIRTAASAALAFIYGEAKFSLGDHGDYPDVPKSHPNWPYRMDKGRRIPLHRFDFREKYTSNTNKETFELWVDTTHNRLQSPTTRSVGGHQPSALDFTRKAVTAICSRLYSNHKSRYKTLTNIRKGPAIPIKRKAETEAPEPLLEGEDIVPATLNNATYAAEPEIGIDATGDIPQHFSFTSYLQSDFVDVSGTLPVTGDTLSATSPTHLVHSSSHTTNPAPGNTATLEPLGIHTDVKPFQGQASSQGTRRREANNQPDTIRSRKAVKAQMRLRKRPYLGGSSEKYKDPKYNTYFTPGAMSEDEEVVDEMEDGYVKSTHFEAHAIDSASDELIAIRTAIDAIADPHPSNRTRRERGTNKIGPPNVSQTPDTGMRTWMIKEEVMSANPNWIDEHRVYMSGALWGEPEPSNLPAARRAIKKIRVEALPGLSLARHADANALLAQKRRDEYMNSRMI